MRKSIFIIGVMLQLSILSACLEGGVSSSSENTTTEPTGTTSGSITSFIVYGSYMYTLDANVILTHSLEDPDEPELISTLELDYGLETIFLYDDFIYVGSTSSLYIVDVTNPENPKLVSKKTRKAEFFNACDPVVVKDNYAYSTVKIIVNRCGNVNSRSALLIYDVTNKNNPAEVGTYRLNRPNGMGIKDNTLFVCDTGADRLKAYNIENPGKTKSDNSKDIALKDPYDIIVNGNRMLVSTTNGFHIYDVSDLSNIFKVGTIEP